MQNVNVPEKTVGVPAGRRTLLRSCSVASHRYTEYHSAIRESRPDQTGGRCRPAPDTHMFGQARSSRSKQPERDWVELSVTLA